MFLDTSFHVFSRWTDSMDHGNRTTFWYLSVCHLNSSMQNNCLTELLNIQRSYLWIYSGCLRVFRPLPSWQTPIQGDILKWLILMEYIFSSYIPITVPFGDVQSFICQRINVKSPNERGYSRMWEIPCHLLGSELPWRSLSPLHHWLSLRAWKRWCWRPDAVGRGRPQKRNLLLPRAGCSPHGQMPMGFCLPFPPFINFTGYCRLNIMHGKFTERVKQRGCFLGWTRVQNIFKHLGLAHFGHWLQEYMKMIGKIMLYVSFYKYNS